MKEYKPEQSMDAVEYGRNILQSVIQQSGPSVVRPCPACVSPCSCSGSSSCGCDCSWDCPSLPEQLSSDPEKYPIEKEIIPLVFAVNSLQHCPSYWSCEGHENEDGELLKVPRVNFYSNTTQIPSLITECLVILSYKKVTAYRWKVTSVGMTDDLQSQYMIEPDMVLGEKNILSILQQDVRKIASNLFSGVKEKARHRLRNSYS